MVSFCAQHQFLNSWFQVCPSCLTYENGSDPFIYLFLAAVGLCCHAPALCWCLWAFSSCDELGLLSSCHMRGSHCRGFSCGAQAPGCVGFGSCTSWALEGMLSSCGHGLICPMHVRSSRTRDSIHVPCIDRQILNHWTTREVPVPILLNDFSLPTER